MTSRIPWYFHFDDYSVTQMWEILLRKMEQRGYMFHENEIDIVKSRVLDCFTSLQKRMDGVKENGKTKHFFGNGRGVRTFFQYMQIGLAVRMDRDREDDLHIFTLEDIEFAFRKFMQGAEKLTIDNTPRIGFGN